MPYVTDSEHAEHLRLQAAVDDVRHHVNAWIRLLETHVASLPPDEAPSAEDSGGRWDRGYAEHELGAMRRDLRAMFPDVVPQPPAPAPDAGDSREDWKLAAETEAGLRRRAYTTLVEIRDMAPNEIRVTAERIVGRRADQVAA